MNKELKKNIRILAEKFNHNIEYQKDVIILKSKLNEIKLQETDKYGTHISYNINESLSDNLKVETENIYDIIIELFYRKEQGKKLTPKLGMLLTIEEWIKEEGKFAKKQLETLRRDLQSEQIEFRNLGGNRYQVEYYNGILILIDDLCLAKSNVISI